MEPVEVWSGWDSLFLDDYRCLCVTVWDRLARMRADLQVKAKREWRQGKTVERQNGYN